MPRSVIITTPMPTWEETVARYGLSKADQKFVIRLVERKATRGSMGVARASRGTGLEFRSASARRSPTVAGKTGGSARKKTNRARASA
jgi:hypothetical protein